MNKDGNRNNGLDVLKCICAFFVIAIHCKRVPGIPGLVINAWIFTAVPLFFMITGFFYQRTVDHGRVKSQIINVLKLLCWASIFYFVLNGILAIATGSTVDEYIKSYMDLKKALLFLFLCDSPFQGHLWYLSAILYVLIGIALFEKKWSRKKLYWLIPVLLVGHLVVGKYSMLLLGRKFPMKLVRNEFFPGLTYFLFGDYLYQKKDGLVSTMAEKKKLLAVIAMVLVITSILVFCFLENRGLNAGIYRGISTAILIPVLFVLFINISAGGGGLLHWLAQVGRKHSTMIYIIHPALLSLLSIVLQQQSESVLFRWITPVAVFMASYGCSVLFGKMKTLIEKRIDMRIFKTNDTHFLKK